MCTRFWLFILLAIFCVSSQALPASTYAERHETERRLAERLKNISAPGIFKQTVSFVLPTRTSSISAVIYGNKDIGYFSSKNFRLKQQKIEIDLIPPTYLKPLQFSIRTENGEKNLGQRSFVHPLKGLFDKTEVMQSPTVPFFIVNWSAKIPIPAVVNRLGETVWMFDPKLAKGSNVYAMNILDDGDFQLLRSEATSHFYQVSSFGEVRRDIDFAPLHRPSSHGFQYLSDSHEIIYLSFDCRELPWWREFVPFFSGVRGWWNLLTQPRRSYRGSSIERLNLDTLEVRRIWSTYNTYSPAGDPSLASGFFNIADRFMDVRSADQYRLFLQQKDFFTWTDWPEKYCQVDWTHANSVQYRPGSGYLVSLRNLNEIAMLDESGRLKWRMGEGGGADLSFPLDGSSFSMQHSAVSMEDGRVLLYDNHTAYRGFTGERIGNRIMIIDPRKGSPVKPDWQFILPTAHSDVRGSVSTLRNGNIFSYTGGNIGMPEEIFEIDPKMNRIVGQVRIANYGANKGFEAKPFYAFAGDQYLGNAKISEPVEVKDRDMLEFSY